MILTIYIYIHTFFIYFFEFQSMTEALETQVKSKVTIKVKVPSVGFDSNSCIGCVMDRFGSHILLEVFHIVLRCDFLFLGKLRSERGKVNRGNSLHFS